MISRVLNVFSVIIIILIIVDSSESANLTFSSNTTSLHRGNGIILKFNYSVLANKETFNYLTIKKDGALFYNLSSSSNSEYLNILIIH